MNFSRRITMKNTKTIHWRIPYIGQQYDICLRRVSQDFQSIPGKIVERHYVMPVLKLPAQTIPMYAISDRSTWLGLRVSKRWKKLLNSVLPFYWLAPSTRIFLLQGSIRLETRIVALDSVSWDSTNGCFVIIGSTGRTKN